MVFMQDNESSSSKEVALLHFLFLLLVKGSLNFDYTGK